MYPQTMFQNPDSNNSSNSFTDPHSDHQSLLYSKLLDDVHIDNSCHNSPYSPFSSFAHHFHADPPPPPFWYSSDHHEQQPLQIQNNPGEEQLPRVAEIKFTMATSNKSTNMSGNCTAENFHYSDFAGDPTDRIGSTSAVRPVKHDDMVRKNGIFLKKARHSKIDTAQGPRDRRMRLSLDIARRFFGLQDMLRFDKASQTVEWLLSKSQLEINKVARSKDNNACISDKSDSFSVSECCEEVSEVDNKDDQSAALDTDKETKKSCSREKKIRGKILVSSRSHGFNNLSNKESREKARARARERTKEKMMINNSQCHTKQQEFLNQGPQTYSYVDQGHMMTDQDESLANTTYWNPSSTTISNHLQQQNRAASQQSQFGDIQFYAQPWEIDLLLGQI